MNDDLAQLQILMTEISSFSKEKKVMSDIIFYTLSWAIHAHGWAVVYSLVVSKIPEFKSSLVKMHCFFYPETHNEMVVSTLEKMADSIITL